MPESWIQTYTGKKFDPLSPNMHDICLGDIAHHLSMDCRFTGAVSHFYSVAQHSVLVSIRAEELAKENNHPSPSYVARAGLLHDASEAYIRDVSRPLKVQDIFAGYRELEAKLQAMIYCRFGLIHPEPAEVKQADNEMLATEARDLMQPLHPDWVRCLPLILRPLPDFRIQKMMPDSAEQFFLERANFLRLT